MKSVRGSHGECRKIGAAARRASAVGRKFQAMRGALDSLREQPAACAQERVGHARATVAQRLHDAERIPHQQDPLGTQIRRHERPGPRELGLVRDDLPGSPEQRVPLERPGTLAPVHPAGKSIGSRGMAGGPAGGGHCSGESSGKDRLEIGHAAALGRRPVDVLFRPEREVLPQHFQNADEPERDALRIELRLGSVLDQATDELAHQDCKALVLLSANVVVFLPRAGFAPERIPDGDFAGAGDFGIQVKVDHQLQRRDRVGLEFGDRHEQLVLELGGQELEGRDQHRGLGVEVETDDTGRHFRDGHHFLHGGSRRTIDVQRRYAGIDQTLPLPIVGGTRPRRLRRGLGLFLARTHARG